MDDVLHVGRDVDHLGRQVVLGPVDARGRVRVERDRVVEDEDQVVDDGLERRVAPAVQLAVHLAQVHGPGDLGQVLVADQREGLDGGPVPADDLAVVAVRLDPLVLPDPVEEAVGLGHPGLPRRRGAPRDVAGRALLLRGRRARRPPRGQRRRDGRGDVRRRLLQRARRRGRPRELLDLELGHGLGRLDRRLGEVGAQQRCQ